MAQRAGDVLLLILQLRMMEEVREEIGARWTWSE
jgi:hypothetical protein